MKEYLRSKVSALSQYLEMLLSLILGIVIIILSGKLLIEVFNPDLIMAQEDVFNYYLGHAMNLAVGVELIKMLCMHSPGTIIEVLLFAIARQVVVSHDSVVQTMAGVLAIAILFAVRKYLFIPHDDVTRVTLWGSQTVNMANRLAKVRIPDTDGKILRDVMEKRIERDGLSKEIGTCVDYDNFALCIASMKDGQITRVDILKTN